MQIDTSSPFSPGHPGPIEFFTGRNREIDFLRDMVMRAARGKFEIGFITGERGIGKSSLAAFVRHLVQREDKAVGCHVFLGGTRNLEQMLSATFNRLLKESADKPWYQKVKRFFGDRIRSVDLLGLSLKLDLTNDDLLQLGHNFVPAISKFLEELADERRVLLLILDDINGLAGSDRFANWLKSTVDEIGTSTQNVQLCILVVGLEERRQELIKSQPSLARVFRLINLAPWSEGEIREFYQNSFASVGAKVDERDLSTLIEFSGGMPVLAHEIGDAVWRAAAGCTEVDQRQVSVGVINAAEIIGRKLIDPQVFSAIRSELYRSILRRMSGELRFLIKRSELLDLLAEDEGKVVDNFFNRMKQVGALISDPEIRGGYRFPNRLYALYFWMESRRMNAEAKVGTRRTAP